MANAIMIIVPYWYYGTWVFDDERVGLLREPFVSGIPEMINDLVKDIPDPQSGFRLLFSSSPFPGYQRELTWVRGDFNGNWYRLGEEEGWLCPAMFHYFEEAPEKLYVKAEQ
ncbi:DUF6717 family protein [Chloroflexota bacterium]